jgi:hypothetical protein
MAPQIYNEDGNILQRHPAEASMPIVTVLAALIAKILGVEDTETILYISLVLAFIPTAITWLVNKYHDVDGHTEVKLKK